MAKFVARCLHSFLLLCVFRTAKSADCGSKTVGYGTSHRTKAGSAGTVLIKDGNYQFDCCGVVETWEFYAKTSGTVTFQIWRPGSSNFRNVGQNAFTVPSGVVNQLLTFTVPQSERITVDVNDYIGWHQSAGIIPYSTGTGTYPDGIKLVSGSAKSLGSTYNFNSAGSNSNRAYSIQAVTSNSKAPYLLNLPRTLVIYDDAAVGSTVHTVTSGDFDYDYNGVTVSMTSPSSYFTMSSSNVNVISSLSGKRNTNFPLTIKAEDTCTKTSTATLTVRVLNKVPVITSLPTSVEVAETLTTQTLLHTIAVTERETVSCTVSDTDPAGAPFTVKETSAGSGVYGVYNNVNPGFDYYTVKRYDITVSCTDTEDVDAEKLIVLVQKNEPPVFNNLPAETTKDQQNVASGDTLFAIGVSDPENDALTYTFTCDPSSCPIDIASDGTITATKPLSSVNTPGYDVSVTVRDDHTSVGTKSWSLQINNVNDIPQFANAHTALKYFGVEENLASGTSVFKIYSTDLDLGDTVQYTWNSNPSDGTSYFALDQSTGEITTSTALDYDTMTNDLFRFTVKVSDSKGTSTTTLTISVVNVNEAPSFSSPSYSITGDEDVAGTKLSTPGFTVTDEDDQKDGDTEFYSLDCGGYATSYFEMDSSNGDVYLGGDFDADLGYPLVTTCTVTVRDTAGLTGTTSLTITISDVNDHTPQFDSPDFTFYLSPYDPVGTLVASVLAADDDVSPQFSSVAYTVDTTSLGDAYFAVDGDGNITVNKDLSSFGWEKRINFSLTATDLGGLKDTTTIHIIFPEIVNVTTTTTERPYTFWEDPWNVTWLEPVFAAGVAIAILIILICLVYCKFNSQSPDMGSVGDLSEILFDEEVNEERQLIKEKKGKDRLKSINHIKAENERNAINNTQKVDATQDTKGGTHKNDIKSDKDKLKARKQ